MGIDVRSVRENYLKRHTDALIKDIGFARACEVSGKSKATLGRYASLHDENADRFMPVNVLLELERVASVPYVTKALAELQHIRLEYENPRDDSAGLTSDVIRLSQRFAILMAEYNNSISDGVISLNETRRLLDETNALQQVLMEMKLHLQNAAG
ncbi:hypothetical protein EF888_00355 [Silicimonas algicola]|uniref:Phage regulatory protein CII n=1 Tax=Silicimonas algicola TaxID=1826607 RepID=A0A316G6U2_9RHOB|nr:hypothetical protein [Silicimonas algicola]AZQ65715.1 hypothetical protein EF888_00355 [Silicimonas algicola]PWK56661.1 hypothetical protein C8D95_104335 [Silicimonas algicola]